MPVKVSVWVYAPRVAFAGNALARGVEPFRKFLDFLPPETTIGELFSIIERRVKEAYLTPGEWSQFVIKNLRDKDDNDLETHLTLELLAEGVPPSTIIKCETAATDRGLSIPITSSLRPLTHHDAPLRHAPSNSFVKVHPDQPIRSSEIPDETSLDTTTITIPDSQETQPGHSSGPTSKKQTKQRPRVRKRNAKNSVVDENVDDIPNTQGKERSLELGTTPTARADDAKFKKPLIPNKQVGINDEATTAQSHPTLSYSSTSQGSPRSRLEREDAARKTTGSTAVNHAAGVSIEASPFGSLRQAALDGDAQIVRQLRTVQSGKGDSVGSNVVTPRERLEQLKAQRRLSGLESDLDQPPRPKSAKGQTRLEMTRTATPENGKKRRRDAPQMLEKDDSITDTSTVKRAKTVPPKKAGTTSIPERAGLSNTIGNQDSVSTPSIKKFAGGKIFTKSQPQNGRTVETSTTLDLHTSKHEDVGWQASWFETSHGPISVASTPPYNVEKIKELNAPIFGGESGARHLALMATLKEKPSASQITPMDTPNTAALKDLRGFDNFSGMVNSLVGKATDLDHMGSKSDWQHTSNQTIFANNDDDSESAEVANNVARAKTTSKQKLVHQHGSTVRSKSTMAGKQAVSSARKKKAEAASPLPIEPGDSKISSSKGARGKDVISQQSPSSVPREVRTDAAALKLSADKEKIPKHVANGKPPTKLTPVKKSEPSKTSLIKTSLKGKGRAVPTPETAALTPEEISHEIGQIDAAVNGAGPSRPRGQTSSEDVPYTAKMTSAKPPAKPSVTSKKSLANTTYPVTKPVTSSTTKGGKASTTQNKPLVDSETESENESSTGEPNKAKSPGAERQSSNLTSETTSDRSSSPESEAELVMPTPTPPKSSAITQPTRSSPLSKPQANTASKAHRVATSAIQKDLKPLDWSNQIKVSKSGTQNLKRNNLVEEDSTENDSDDEETGSALPKKSSKQNGNATAPTTPNAKSGETSTMWGKFKGTVMSAVKRGTRDNTWAEVPPNEDDGDESDGTEATEL